MKFGVLFFPTVETIRPDALGEELEQRGFESLWVTEHTHIPTSRASPWAGGDRLPEHYKRTLDPYVALTAAAVATRRLRLGTGISLIAQRHPITLAKEVASLDVISGGRFHFGVGFGWNKEEMAHHGIDPTKRREVVREYVQAMKDLWMREEPAFEGEYVQFAASWSFPKPVQRPHPPILLGASGSRRTFEHVAEYADGWMPIHGRQELSAHLENLTTALHSRGRDPSDIEISVVGCPPNPVVISEYENLGVSRCILPIPAAPEPEVIRALDEYCRGLDIGVGY